MLVIPLHSIAREGYIVVSFDNQGTPAPRGREWRKVVYGAIGVLSKQQAEAVQEFARQHTFVDATRVGIWGHSGGGSTTPITFAEGLEGHLLIMHGSGDDNVHFQGTERLVNRLIELGKLFDFMDYPNRTHGISEGTGTLFHRYSLMMRFFETYIPPALSKETQLPRSLGRIIIILRRELASKPVSV